MPRMKASSMVPMAVLAVAACRGDSAPLAPPSSLTLPAVGLPGFPGTVTDLAVDEVTPNSATLSFTEVDDGLGQPAYYVVRYASRPIDWGSAQDVQEGTCSPPVFGNEIGARLTCTVAGLGPATTYEFQVTANRSTLDLVTVSGEPSNVAQGTTVAGCDCWMPTAPMPTARVGLGVATIDGILYVVGGSVISPLATVEAYDPATDTWTTKASMPTARHAPGAVAIDGILYVVGGEAGAQANHATLATFEAYDPSTDTWTPRLSMPTARSRLGVAVIDGILYAVGGFNRLLGAVATLEAYDPVSGVWTSKTRMSLPRYGLGVGAMDGSVYAVGGFMNGPRATNEAYDPVSDTWTTKAELPTVRVGHGVGVIGVVLYAVGGSDYVAGPIASVVGYRP